MNKRALLVGGLAVGALLLLSRRAVAAKPTRLRVPTKARPYLGHFQKWSEATGIPLDVLLAWAMLESGYNPNEYNVERGVMREWACAVANDARWARNPDYGKVKTVCANLASGKWTVEDVIRTDSGKPFREKLWTFGSSGIMQVARRWNYECLDPSRPNTELFEIDMNLRCGCKEIDNKIRGLYQKGAINSSNPRRLTDNEWGLVRASYVMGVSGALANPAGAEERRTKFKNALRELR